MYTLNASETRYFYFENWDNSTLKFQYVIEGKRAATFGNNQIDLRVVTIHGKQLPQYEKDLPTKKWLHSRSDIGAFNEYFKDSIEVSYQTKKFDYCVHCYFVIRL